MPLEACFWDSVSGLPPAGVRMTDTPSIVNETEVEWEDELQGESFAYRRKALASAANGEKLGCSLYEVPPGKRPFPYHYHTANEEAIFVLSGNGTLKTQGETREITVGDYVVLPVGEPGARQIINATDEPLQYLCLSTMISPEIVGYPNSGKFGLFAGSAPFGSPDRRTLTKYLPEDAETDYWDEEGE